MPTKFPFIHRSTNEKNPRSNVLDGAAAQWTEDVWCFIYPFPKFNIAPEKSPSQKESRFPTIFFQGAMLIFGSVRKPQMLEGEGSQVWVDKKSE